MSENTNPDSLQNIIVARETDAEPSKDDWYYWDIMASCDFHW